MTRVGGLECSEEGEKHVATGYVKSSNPGASNREREEKAKEKRIHTKEGVWQDRGSLYWHLDK